LPVPNSNTFQVVYASGAQPARDLGWELEEALDIQYAHAMAPNATIYLVEAASASFSSLLAAVDKASQWSPKPAAVRFR
jgi:subtilase family serine protease